MVVALGDETGKILEQKSIPTTTPEETIPQIIDYFSQKNIAALGIGAFGPVDVVKGSPTYGRILNTPKIAWRQYDLVGALKEALHVPIGLDTDVNGSCLGEMTYGCAKGLDTVVYLTIGTGIGAGIAVGGRLLHDSCLEGLASGPSIEARWGKKAYELVDKQVVWELESEYLAKGIANMILTLSPQRIILGGGVMHQEQLFPMIRSKVLEYLNHYYETPYLEDMEHYIVPASLHDDQGIMGAVRLAQLAYAQEI